MSSHSPRKQGEDKSRHMSASSTGSRSSGHKAGGASGSRQSSQEGDRDSKGASGTSKGKTPKHGATTDQSKSSQKGGKKPSPKESPTKPHPTAGAGIGETRPPHVPPAEKKKPLTKAERRELQEAQRKAKAEKKAVTSKGGTVGGGENTSGDSKRSSAMGKSASGEGGMEDHGHKASHGQKSGRPAKITKASSQDKPSQKQVQLFSHLPQYERELPPTRSLDSTAGSIHPCIIKLGLQYSEGIICGSNARCIALLAAFKKVIQGYSTPPEKELRRDLDATIKPYITFLSRCRPLSVSMGNAIKHLKLKISNIPPDVTEIEAKDTLCEAIDDYLRDKIRLADKAISGFCQNLINEGDVILVHAYSSIVQKALIDAHKAGKKFRVIVADSRPKLEGRHSLRQLVQSGIKCSYVFINAVSYIMKEVSKVLVGAHGLLANGYVMSRVGTSLIALVAKSYNVPFLVCCETYKFCDKVQTDSFVINELGDPSDIVPIHRRQGNYLTDWKSIQALRLLNLVYDVTAPDLITMVITQVGLIPCTSVPVVLRISRDLEQMQAT